MGFDQLAHKRAHPRDELRLAASAVGKEGIVGDVDVARIGPRLDDLAKNGEAAEPGIKDEDARCHEDLWLQLLHHMTRRSLSPPELGPARVRHFKVAEVG